MSKQTNKETKVEGEKVETAEKLSPEQLEQNRKKVLDYYKKQVEVIKYQAEYEGYLADIEQSRARRMEMIIRQAQMSAGPQDEPEENEPRDPAPAPEPKERKLKTV
jgi:hypothetical protein